VTHWKKVLPHFEREWIIFQNNIQYLRKNPEASLENLKPYKPVPLKIISQGCQAFKLGVGRRPYFTMEPYLHRINPELLGLTAIRIDNNLAHRQVYNIEFELTEPAYAFAAFASSSKDGWAKPTRDWQVYTKHSITLHPEEGGEKELDTIDLIRKNLSQERIAELLEEHGGIEGFYSLESYLTNLDVYVKKFPAGRSKINIGPGRFIVLGFSQANVPLYPKESRVIQRRYLFTRPFATDSETAASNPP
jgi:hypothetical protein